MSVTGAGRGLKGERHRPDRSTLLPLDAFDFPIAELSILADAEKNNSPDQECPSH